MEGEKESYGHELRRLLLQIRALLKTCRLHRLRRFCAVFRGMACAAIPDLLADRPRRFDGDLGGLDGWGGSISRWSAPSAMGPRILDGHPGYLGICRDHPRRSGPPMAPAARAGSRSTVLLARRARGNPRYGRHRSRADLVDHNKPDMALFLVMAWQSWITPLYRETLTIQTTAGRRRIYVTNITTADSDLPA